MTDKVDPSPSSDGQAYMIAQTIKQHGSVGDGWIAESDTAYAADHTNSGITDAPLNAFAKVDESGLDVTIDTGEAFIGGAWIARDTQTTVTLADDTSNQTVYAGWDTDATDTVVVGLDAAFSNNDHRIPLYDFDTANGSVTDETDRRTVGKQSSLGAAELGAGSTIARFLMTAASEDVKGTEGNSTNEMWRAGTSTSDLVMSVVADGRMNLVWNAYYTGSEWRYIVGSEPAYRLRFGNNGIALLSATTGTADAEVTWAGVRTSHGGDLYDVSTDSKIYDEIQDEVPQERLGGAASNLGTYPIPASDIDDGPDSGLDADTLDGQEPSEISGGWAVVDTHSDDDGLTPLDYSYSFSTTYSRVRLEIYRESSTDTETYMDLRVNQDGSSDYYYDWFDAWNGEFHSETDNNRLGKIAGVGGETGSGSTTSGHTSMQTIEIARPAFENLDISHKVYPLFSTPVIGVGMNTSHMFNGHLRQEYESINHVRVWSPNNSAGRIRLLGNADP